MKNFHILLFFLVALLTTTYSNAQDENNSLQLSFGVNAIDVYPTGGNQVFAGEFGSEFFNVSDHWNIIPSISYLSVSKYIGDGFSVGARGSLNKIDKLGDQAGGDLSHYALDATLKYNILENTKVDPFVEIGGGHTWLENINQASFNAGIGLNYWFTENLGFTYQSTFKQVFIDEGVTHFQHLAGVSLKFGGKDSDKDGVYDKKDACPDIPGLEAFDGCPDSDGDGIEDSKDVCPNVAGDKEHDGCPDTDGDNIADKDDLCPEVAGLEEFMGCPDSDGDGVTDASDNCPQTSGPQDNNGCPYPDSDGDSVIDKEDKCPEIVGSVANDGCPEITPEFRKRFEEYDRTVLFNTGKFLIKSDGTTLLLDLIGIIKNFPTAEFILEGHADSRGGKKFNQTLSETRANAVKEFLIDRGIEAGKLSIIGYGEERPVSSNTSEIGRKRNRRVVVNLAN